MINTVLALLVKYAKLTEEEAEALSEKLAGGISPARFKDALKQIEDLLEEIKK